MQTPADLANNDINLTRIYPALIMLAYSEGDEGVAAIVAPDALLRAAKSLTTQKVLEECVFLGKARLLLAQLHRQQVWASTRLPST